MTERIVASNELRQLVAGWQRTGLPAPVGLTDGLLLRPPASQSLLEEIMNLASEEDRFANSGTPARGSDHWRLRDQIRAKLQEALLAGLVDIDLVQRLALAYGAMPHPDQGWKYFYDHDGCWSCWRCGAEILVKTVANSIHHAEWRGLTGSGEVRRQHVPYCPTCDPEPRNGSVTESLAESLVREMR